MVSRMKGKNTLIDLQHGFSHALLGAFGISKSQYNPVDGNHNTLEHVYPVALKAMEEILILHADHEQNASTTAAKTVASTKASIESCVMAGINALWGSAHGGANAQVINMLKDIGAVENIDSFIQDVKLKQKKLMGFGHRVYKNFDPRAIILKQTCHHTVNFVQKNFNSSLLNIASNLEERALSDQYFIERKLYPNVDFYSGIILTSHDIDQDFFPMIFAISRTLGWIAQIKEMVNNNDEYKIYRPRQIFKQETLN